MKVYEILKYLRTNTIPMANVKVKIGEIVYPIKDITWTGLENGGEVVIEIEGD